MPKRNVHKTSPLGKATPWKSDIGSYGRLYDFDRDGDELKAKHMEWLRQNVVHFLHAGGSVTIEGLTDSTASVEHDQDLSEDRVKAVEKFLHDEVPGAWKLQSAIATGKTEALRKGDNKRDEWYRAVDVTAWSNPTPPPVKAEPPIEIKAVRRITYRYFLEMKGLVPKPSGVESMNRIELLIELFWKTGSLLIASDDDGEDKTLRKYADLPPSWEVNVVNIKERYLEVMAPGLDTGYTSRAREVSYEWGVSAAMVHVKTHFEYSITMGGDSKPFDSGGKDTSKMVTRKDARRSTLYTPRD